RPSFALRLLNYKHGYTNARMQNVKQEVLAVDFVDVAVVVVGPVGRPGIDQLKRVATVNHYRLRRVHHSIALHVEVMFPTKVRVEPFFGNASTAISRVLVAVTIISLNRAMVIVHRALLFASIVALVALLLVLRPGCFRLLLTLVLAAHIRIVIAT